MNNVTVLQTESNGVEFFTIVETGDCAVSEIGLSRMTGVNRQTMRRWFSDFAHRGTPKWLEPLHSMSFDFAHEIVKRGKPIKAIPAKTASKFLTLVARNLKTDEALESLDAIAEIGLTSYIQSQTGWLPENLKAAPQAQDQLNRILDFPDIWQKFYEKTFCDRIMKIYGIDFYWEVVYAAFTPEEYEKVNKLNPVKKGKRDKCIHQYIEPETKKRMELYLRMVQAILNGAESREQFDRAYFRQFGIHLADRYRDLLEGYWDMVAKRIEANKARQEA